MKIHVPVQTDLLKKRITLYCPVYLDTYYDPPRYQTHSTWDSDKDTFVETEYRKIVNWLRMKVTVDTNESNQDK